MENVHSLVIVITAMVPIMNGYIGFFLSLIEADYFTGCRGFFFFLFFTNHRAMKEKTRHCVREYKKISKLEFAVEIRTFDAVAIVGRGNDVNVRYGRIFVCWFFH